MKIIYFSIAFCLFSCTGSPAVSIPIEDSTSITEKASSINHPAEVDSIESMQLNEQESLLVNKTDHAFSDNASQDVFRLVVTGKSILKGKVVFTITNAKLGEIYRDEFDAESLIGWGIDSIQNPSVKQQEVYIRKRVADFFKASKFSNPAIEADTEFDEEGFIDKRVWKEIQSDKNAIGFFYLIDKANGRNIAYSRKYKKGVVYSACC